MPSSNLFAYRLPHLSRLVHFATVEKKRRDWLKQQARQHTDWLLVDQDECWFSRFAQPTTQTWYAADAPVYLLQREPKRGEKEQALACFGAVRHDTQQVLLSFSNGQPDSLQTWLFVMGLLAVARQENKRVLVIIWDNASWHKSKDIRRWIRAYNHAAKRCDEPRLIVHGLPTKSPWLNPIEPRWRHAKRAVCQPEGDLTATELRKRLCHYFETQPLLNVFKIDDL